MFRDKAIVTLDGGTPRTLKVGQTVGDITLLSADSDRAVFRVGGVRREMRMGQSFAAAPLSDARTRITLTADARGHFSAAGAINSQPVNFLVDTGASSVVISADDARRFGIDYRRGLPARVATANGEIPAWQVNFASVKFGTITLNQVEGLVLETALLQPLLGASFLNRMEMRREGTSMTLIRRY